MMFKSLRRAIPIVAIGCLGCTDGPMAPDSSQWLGTVNLPPGSGAIVLEFDTTVQLDSVRMGPAPGTPGAYLVSKPTRNRVMVLAPEGSLAERIRFRAYYASTIESPRARVIQIAAPDGHLVSTENTAVYFRR